MNPTAAIKDPDLWLGAIAGTTSDDAAKDVRDLLREIRDLQRAHFERYQQFTANIMSMEKVREQDAERLRHEQMMYQEHLRQTAAQTQTRQMIMSFVWFGIVGLLLASMFLSHFFLDFEF